jgi:hypothetical protein
MRPKKCISQKVRSKHKQKKIQNEKIRKIFQKIFPG